MPQTHSADPRIEKVLPKQGELLDKTTLEIFHALGEGIILLDTDQNIIFMNQTVKNIFNFRESNSIKKIIELTHSTKLEEFSEKVSTSSGVLSEELEISYPKHTFLRVRGQVIDCSTQKITAITVQNTTAIVKLEKTRSEFVANVSHELKTPLTSIKGFTETLLSGAVTDHEQSNRFLQIMQEDIIRLERLISDLLDLSHIESGNIKLGSDEIDAANLLEDLIPMFDSLLKERQITLINNLKKDAIPKIKGNSDQLKQVLINLIDNAIKFNKPSGSVTIDARSIDVHWLEIKITDTGIGIENESIPRIFERFYRVDRARSRHLGGTGLGLSIVKHIIEGNGGRISCTSKLGEGSEFVFTVPAATGR